MLNRVRNGFSATQVEAALHSANQRIAFRYELYDRNGNFKANLSTVIGGAVEYNALNDIKRTARFTLKDAQDVDYLNDRIKPYCRVWLASAAGWAEFALGLFLLTTAPRTIDVSGAVIRSVQAYDLAQILADDKVSTRYTVTAGTNYITAVKALLDGAGITAQNLTATSKTLPATKDWAPGTSKLEIINDLLAAVNYNSLWFDENGVAVASPYMTPAERASEYTYANDSESVMFPEAEQSLDLWNVPNKWVLVVSESDRTVISSEYTNTNPDSPTSTVSRGRTIVDYRTVDADSQASLDDLVERAAFESSQVYEAVQFGTAVMPFHSHNDVFTLEYTDLGIAAKYSEVYWGFELKAGATMKHVIRRVITV